MSPENFIIEYHNHLYEYIGEVDGKACLQSINDDTHIEISFRDLFLSSEFRTEDEIRISRITTGDISYDYLNQYESGKTFPIIGKDDDGNPTVISRSRNGEFYEVRTHQKNGWVRINVYWYDGMTEETYEKDRSQPDMTSDQRKGKEKRKRENASR